MDEQTIQNPSLQNSCADNANNNVDGEFPVGLKILLVDDSRPCLLVLERMLRKFLYEVTTCQLAKDALALLRENHYRFDIVMCDLHMPEMDGFKFLEILGLETDLPVVIMSSDDRRRVIIQGIINGACDYMIKPVRMESIRFIWQHVIRRKKRCLPEFQQPSNNVDDGLSLLRQVKDEANQTHARDKGGSLQSLKRTREDEDEDNGEFSDEVTTAKKPRMIWTPELHEMFVAAINQLGRDKAVPKKILERMQAMNVTGLTRANIASHLQKYRMHLQKNAGAASSENKDNLNAYFEQASSIHQRNLQALPTGASCHQLPLQNLMAPQPCRYERANENFSTGPTDQGSNMYDTTGFSVHDLSRANLLYHKDFAGGVAISNEEYFYRNEGNVAEISNPLSVDELIYEPSVLVRQFDQDDIFRGPFV